MRRKRLIYEGPEGEGGLAVLGRRLRVLVREGTAREEAILEERERRHHARNFTTTAYSSPVWVLGVRTVVEWEQPGSR